MTITKTECIIKFGFSFEYAEHNVGIGDDGVGVVPGFGFAVCCTNIFTGKVAEMDKMVDGAVWSIRNYQLDRLSGSQSGLGNWFYCVGVSFIYHNRVANGSFSAGFTVHLSILYLICKFGVVNNFSKLHRLYIL